MNCAWPMATRLIIKIDLIDLNYLTTTLILISWGCSFKCSCHFRTRMKWCDRNCIIIRNVITNQLIIHFICLLQHLFHLLPLCFLDARLQFSFFLSLASLFPCFLLPLFSFFLCFSFSSGLVADSACLILL